MGYYSLSNTYLIYNIETKEFLEKETHELQLYGSKCVEDSMMQQIMKDYSSSMNKVVQPSIADFVSTDPLLNCQFNAKELETPLLDPSMTSIPITSLFPVCSLHELVLIFMML